MSRKKGGVGMKQLTLFDIFVEPAEKEKELKIIKRKIKKKARK